MQSRRGIFVHFPVAAAFAAAQRRAFQPRFFTVQARCIDGDGAYVRIAGQMRDLAGGSLPITQLRDMVDMDGGRSWLQFLFRGRTVHIDIETDADWIDGELFAHFVQLLAESGREKLYLYEDLGGGEYRLTCVRKDEVKLLLRGEPGFRPLTGTSIRRAS